MADERIMALDIVAQHIRQSEYDGLYTDDCGCFVEDLAPCGFEDNIRCMLGYRKHVSECVDGQERWYVICCGEKPND